MGIEISGSPPPPPSSGGGDNGDVKKVGQQQTENRRDPETGRSAATDTVSLTDTAAQLKDIEGKLAAQPVVDVQKVDSIRQAIAAGRYEVDAGRVAERMLQFETDLFGIQNQRQG